MKSSIPIAVVGMAGVFPGALDLKCFWQNILHRKSAAADIPINRWSGDPADMIRQNPSPDKALSRKACLVSDFRFDPDGFELGPDLLSRLDPLYHLVLHTGKTALTHPRSIALNRQKTGVILAAIGLPTDGSSRITRHLVKQLFEKRLFGRTAYQAPDAAEALAARVTSLPAALLAGGLGLSGGAYTLDAACASSLFAVKLACDELRAHRADAMLAGGVSRPDCVYTQVGFSQLRALSPSGRCAPFDASADGLVVGEGAGILVLKRLADALDGGDHIFGVIGGIGLSNDMRGNLLAPDSEGQLRAMRTAYQNAGWQPDTVRLIECHGAGTPVGDNTELNSLNALWRNLSWKTGQCAIGSVKSGIGHLLTAAGAAGMIKTLLAIAHKTLPPSLNFERPPHNSPLPNSPFKVQTEAEEWLCDASDHPRRAAVSAFGFGGINAHLLMEEWRSPPSSAGANPAALRIEETAAAGSPESESAVAIVGLAAAIGRYDARETIQQVITNGVPAVDHRPIDRWNGFDDILSPPVLQDGALGSYLSHIELTPETFRIPPVEYADILPQHLLMLTTAARAMADAGLPLRQERPKCGAVIGAEFDYEATDFQVRWRLHNWLEEWRRDKRPATDCDAFKDCLASLQDAVGPPLTATRTLGALVSMVASRIAREFRMGGPSFTVSGQAASGLHALEIAVRMIQKGELDLALVGAVDLGGDIRQVLTDLKAHRFADSNKSMPSKKGGGPADAAVALVLKPLSGALASGDRVYATIDGFGHCGGLADLTGDPDRKATILQEAFDNALAECGRSSASIEAIELCDLPDQQPHGATQTALNRLFDNRNAPAVIGSMTPLFGHTGAVAALTGVYKACLAAYHRLWFPAAGINPEGWPQPFFRLPESVVAHHQLTSATTAVLATAPKGVSIALVSARPGISGTAVPSTEAPSFSPPPAGPGSIRIPVGRRIDIPTLPAVCQAPVTAHRQEQMTQKLSPNPAKAVFDQFQENIRATAEAHQSFLQFSNDLTRSYADAYRLQAHLLQRGTPPSPSQGDTAADAPAFDRMQCLAFARGKAADVLGSDFSEIDRYPVRVRLPDEPLMLVDRILSVEGTPRSVTKGRIVTEHDIHQDAWYLDGGHAPTCIAVEAGQADLFLCAYLGIDFKVKGQRAYRLLDASVMFHRHLPAPGETIRYEIEIDKFMRQGDTYLFFFHFEGYIGSEHLISMTDGCAGFFTEQEIHRSGGIIDAPQTGAAPVSEDIPVSGPQPLVPMIRERYDDQAVDALRRGDAAGCFGDAFAGIRLPDSQRLPGGRMKLIDRVTEIDPRGGRFGRGVIRAEADIHPEDWFLTCHFVDDMTMPGTLMYECCLHALRLFLLRMGWISDAPTAGYQPVPGIKSVMKCRGPVTPSTRKVVYEIHIKSLGYRPEPFAVADAHMFVDGNYVVRFDDMTLQMSGVTRDALIDFWRRRSKSHTDPPATATAGPVFSRRQVLMFAEGNPSEAFGPPYRPFDSQRFIARLPRPPYSFIDRIVSAEPSPWVLPADGWIVAEFDVHPDHWYFAADRSGCLPYSILLEIALQACGWLAAYAGSALKSEKDLKFRNLEGRAKMHRAVTPRIGTLSTRCRMTKSAMAGDTLIESFEFDLRDGDRPVFAGETTFGFFTPQALDQQRGLAEKDLPDAHGIKTDYPTAGPVVLPDVAPLSPADRPKTAQSDATGMAMPSKALRMIDQIECDIPDGGPANLGYIRAVKHIDPTEWFFDAHFLNDPVCPGSLGIESMLQLIKFKAIRRWPHLIESRRFMPLTGVTHQWIYRGQILPANRVVTVEAVVTGLIEGDQPTITADGWLQVDGLYIYKMENFGFRLMADNDRFSAD